MATTQEKRLDPVVAQGDAEPQIGILPTKQKVGWNDIPPLRAPDNARNIYAGMGIDDLKSRANMTGGQAPQQTQSPTPQPALAGLAAMAVNNPAQPDPASPGYRTEGQNIPAPQAAPSEYSRQMGNVANFFGDAASGAMKTLVSAPGYGLSPSNTAPAAPAAPPAPPYRNEGQNYPAGGKLPSPAVSTAPSTPAAPAGAPQRNAAGALTSIGAGTDIGDGIKKYVVDGKTLYSNVGDSGPGGNLSLMNRGAPTAQNQAAMDALVNRSTAEGAQAVQKLQFQDQVAQAQAINARPNPTYSDPNDLRSPENIARRNFVTSVARNPLESDKSYQLRVGAMLDANKQFSTANAQTNAQELAQQRLAADIGHSTQQLAQSGQRVGIEQAGLGLKQQQVANELATGEQNRAAAGLTLEAAKKVADLQAQYMATDDPKAKTKLAQSIRDLTGKETKADWKFHSTPTIKNADGSTTEGAAYMVNERTNEVVKVGDQKKPQAAQQYEAGKTYTKSVNGNPGNYRFIGTDANGKEMWKPA